MLSDLPQELLAAICDHVTRQDLISLRQISKVFKRIVSPALFRTLTIKLDEPFYGGFDSLPKGYEKDYKALATSGCCKMIKHLHLQSPFHSNLCGRCDYHSADVVSDSDPSELVKLARKLRPILEQLEDHSLRSFSWDIGICIPQGILGPAGYLSDKQTSIRSLSLVTSIECSTPYDDEDYSEPILLSRFRELRKFSWKCLRSPTEYKLLRDLLHANFDIFETLTLESGSRLWNEDALMEDHHSLDLVLPHKPEYSSPRFPPLKSLYLSEFSFTVTNKWAASAIDFSQLHSLALHGCTDTSIFLRGVLVSGQHIALKHLDLKFQDRIYPGWGTSSLVNFLQSFEGLEIFHLMIDPSLPTETYWDAMASHQCTLKRVLYHERGTDANDYIYHRRLMFRDAALKWERKSRAYPWLMLPEWGLDADSTPIEFESTGAPLHAIFAATTLDCLALCDSPAVLRIVLEPYASQLTLKLLHVRRAAVELPHDLLYNIEKWVERGINEDNAHSRRSFSREREYNMCIGLFGLAQWAFGPDGISQLQVLAFGDFSYDGRFPKQSILFCRQLLQPSKTTWRLAKKDETAIFDGIDHPMGFLGACPKDVTVLNRETMTNESERWPGWST